jgi:hypothetical protein
MIILYGLAASMCFYAASLVRKRHITSMMWAMLGLGFGASAGVIFFVTVAATDIELYPTLAISIARWRDTISGVALLGASITVYLEFRGRDN